MTIRVPGSSANLGPGFDALGLALSTHVLLGVVGDDEAPDTAHECDDKHPSQVAFARAGGRGRVWISHSIPMGRGMGFSGAARIAGIVAAEAQQAAGEWRPDDSRALEIGTALEGHADNVAASLVGGIVAVAGGKVVRIDTPLEHEIVLWVPSYTTSTSESRATLGDTVPFTDAVFNIGRTALLVAALAAGDVDALREATADRLHQDKRLARVPLSREALESGLDAGAWCGWLSGSGPTVAFMCGPSGAPAVAESLPADGSVKRLKTDNEGAVVL